MLNYFDNDSDCGLDGPESSAPSYLDSSDIPKTLYYTAPKIQDIELRVGFLELHTFGGQHIKHRYWKIADVEWDPKSVDLNNPDEDNGDIWLSKLTFYENDKIFFNGVQTDTTDCASNDITDQIVSISSSLDPSGAPSWFYDIKKQTGEIIGYEWALIDDNDYTSTRFRTNKVNRILELEVDFGENKKYAVTSITQTGVRLPYQTMSGFTLYARDDVDDPWQKISIYKNIPDPIEIAIYTDPTLQYYYNKWGTGSLRWETTKPYLYNEGGHCLVVDPTPIVDTFPTNIRPMWGCQPERYRFYKIDRIVFNKPDQFNPDVGPWISGFDLYENGSLYCQGSQKTVGNKINNEIQRIAFSLTGELDLPVTSPNANYTYNTKNLFDGDPNSIGQLEVLQENSPFIDTISYIMDFGEYNKKVISSIQQITVYEGEYVKSFRLLGAKSEWDDWVVINEFGVIPGYDGQPIELVDPYIVEGSPSYNKYFPRDTGPYVSPHYAVLQNPEPKVVFPGDASPMWYHPSYQGDRKQTIHYNNFTAIPSGFGQLQQAVYELDISRYRKFLIWDSSGDGEGGTLGFFKTLDVIRQGFVDSEEIAGHFDIVFKIINGENITFNPDDAIKFQVEYRGSPNLTPIAGPPIYYIWDESFLISSSFLSDSDDFSDAANFAYYGNGFDGSLEGFEYVFGDSAYPLTQQGILAEYTSHDGGITWGVSILGSEPRSALPG